MDAETQATNLTCAGVFGVALATLMYEILLTRIFSVTMYYHFAFMAISIAMFGMTVGALWVYLCCQHSSPARTKYEMARSALLFAVSAVFSIVLHCFVVFLAGDSALSLVFMAPSYAVISLPFIFSGICICLALTKFPRHVSKLYAADLAGAATGSVLVIYGMRVTDAPTAVVFVALLASTSAVVFSIDGGFRKLRPVMVIAAVLFAGFVVVNTVLVNQQKSFLRLRWIRGEREHRPVYEKWNSFSRIAVAGNANQPRAPVTEGISVVYPADRNVRELHLTIDAGAETTLTAFDGDLSSVDYLKYDVKNFAHYLRPNASVLVIGAGAGRDVLAALTFGQRSVRAVEVNEDIIRTANGRFGDFTGHLDRNPKVTFVNDEARSYVARIRDRFDIIQVSFIDTWAATAAGGFTLTENSLYTVEAWKLFLERLTPTGILSFSRWYIPDPPAEAYRLTSLAAAALKEEGVVSPAGHIALVKNARRWGDRLTPYGAGTILVSKAPLSASDLEIVEHIANKMAFHLVLTPRFALDATFATLASGKDLERFAASFPLDISPPRDDRPFFFNMLRLRDAFNREWQYHQQWNFNWQAVSVLGNALAIVVTLLLLSVFVPLGLTTRKAVLRSAAPQFVFFAAIGLGFMLVEISQMQRLIVFLGHPTYGLSVVLFALLLSSGLGSYSTRMISGPDWTRSAGSRLLGLLGVLIVFGLLTPRAINAFQASTTVVRIIVATAIIFGQGLPMGMAFPLGLKLASGRAGKLTPWLWGINGATSVCASVFAVAIGLNSGISAEFWTGVSCYTMAYGAFVWAAASARHEVAATVARDDDIALESALLQKR